MNKDIHHSFTPEWAIKNESRDCDHVLDLCGVCYTSETRIRVASCYFGTCDWLATCLYWLETWRSRHATYSGGAENAGVENAGVENTGAETYGKPSIQKFLKDEAHTVIHFDVEADSDSGAQKLREFILLLYSVFFSRTCVQRIGYDNYSRMLVYSMIWLLVWYVRTFICVSICRTLNAISHAWYVH